MTDIVERLRNLTGLCDPECEGRCRECPAEAIYPAADEIERLRAEVERLTEAADGAMRQDRDQLLAEVADLREECAAYRGLQADQENARLELLAMLRLAQAENEEQARLLGAGGSRELRLMAERDALRAALEWYANALSHSKSMSYRVFAQDGGKRARAALAAREGK